MTATAPLTNGGVRHQLATQMQDGIRHAEARIRTCTEEIGKMQLLKAQLATSLVALGITYEAAPEPEPAPGTITVHDPRD